MIMHKVTKDLDTEEDQFHGQSLFLHVPLWHAKMSKELEYIIQKPKDLHKTSFYIR